MDRTNDSVVAFYRRTGYALVDDANYPDAIRDHLRWECSVAEAAFRRGRYEAVVEAGCMDGRLLLGVALAGGLEYAGLDLLPEAVETAAARLRGSRPGPRPARVICADAVRMPELQAARAVPPAGAVCAFPFNSFGNLADPRAAIRASAACGYDILILTYDTTPQATARREEYYARCDYTRLSAAADARGVRFTSFEGLHTYAYHPPVVTEWLVGSGYHVRIERHDELGVAYHGDRPDESIPHYGEEV